jgi:hypothetical protein
MFSVVLTDVWWKYLNRGYPLFGSGVSSITLCTAGQQVADAKDSRLNCQTFRAFSSHDGIEGVVGGSISTLTKLSNGVFRSVLLPLSRRSSRESLREPSCPV